MWQFESPWSLTAAPSCWQKTILQMQKNNFVMPHQPGTDIPVTDVVHKNTGTLGMSEDSHES